MARQRMTRALFEQCKGLQQDRYKIKDVAMIVRMSDVTIGRVFRSDTYEDYQAIISGNHQQHEPAADPERRVKYKVEVTVWEYQY